MLRMVRRFAVALVSGALFFTFPARAEDVVVTRHVVLRSAPARTSDPVAYPAVGSGLTLLEDGVPQSGYLHVRSPDGMVGWVYRTFVARSEPSPDAEPLNDGAPRVTVHVIDVDQGNAMLVEFPCGAMAIDLGGRGEKAAMHLLAYLKRFFLRRPGLHRRFETVAITHTHIDHNVNLRRSIDGRYAVGSYLHNGRLNGSGKLDAIWMSKYVSAPSSTIRADDILEGEVEAQGAGGLSNGDTIDRIACPGVDPEIRVLSGGRTSKPAGWTKADYEEGNNHSLVIRIDFGKSSFLFTGDLEDAGMRDLVQRFAGTELLDADVLLVSHHGADNGTPIDFLNAVTPEFAVISMGPEAVHDDWTAYAYGHPRKATVAKLISAVSGSRPAKQVSVASGQRRFEALTMDKAVYGTGWDGDIVLTADADGRISIATQR